MKYQKPKISSKKIKLNFFLTNISLIDQFTIVGDVYAGSGDCGECLACTSFPCFASACGNCGRGCEGCVGGSGNSGSGSCNSGGN